jgi:hypothetical protein
MQHLEWTIGRRFQFLLVRLKVIFLPLPKRSPPKFQFLLVRLKAIDIGKKLSCISALKKKLNFIFLVNKLSIGKNIKIPDYRQLIFYIDFQYVNDRCFTYCSRKVS